MPRMCLQMSHRETMATPELPSELINWIGYAAALLTTCSFIPQALLTLRSKDVSGISAAMYAALTLGVAGWLAYGWLLGQWPIIVANTVTLVLAATILYVKLTVERRSPSQNLKVTPAE